MPGRVIKIQKDVPMDFAKNKYPFAEMEVGDSFFAKKSEVDKVRSAASHHSKRHGGGRFTTRAVRGGYRCWRFD